MEIRQLLLEKEEMEIDINDGYTIRRLITKTI